MSAPRPPPRGVLPPRGTESAAAASPSRGLRRHWHGARHRFRHSLRWRLVSLFIVLALATSATFFIGVQSLMRGGWQLYAKPLVSDYIDLLAKEIGTPPDVTRAQALVARLPLAIRIDGPVVQWDSHPGEQAGEQASEWHSARPGAQRSGDERAAFGEPVTEREARWQTRVLTDGHRITFGLAGPQPGARMHFAGWRTLAVLLVLTAVAYFVVHRLLRPLGDIRAGVQRFGQGDFSQPIIPRRADELGDLAGRINTMAAGLHGMLDAKRALLLAISHELRSPLTRARVNAELVDEGAPRDALLRDLGEMRDLIADLLESERLAAGHAALHAERCDLNALLRDLVVTQFQDSAFTLELSPDVGELQLDAARIRLLARNLLDNAWRHRGDGPAPLLRTSIEDAELRVTVRDFGAGVSQAHLVRLTEPFYRADEARQRVTGGVGLGLYLCQLVAQAHGGSLSIANASPGLEVKVRIPIVRTHG